MALVQMASVSEATSALIALHNYHVEHQQPAIRISYAKSAIYTRDQQQQQ